MKNENCKYDNDGEFQARVAHNLKGLEFVSTGACPGCAECGLAARDCPECDGTGRQESGADCLKCKGEGKLECSEHDRELAGEASFSWSECECCGSSLGGDRHPAHGWLKREGQPRLLLHFSVCSDCLFFLNYGQLDDMSMMAIEASKA